jgi:hypothetical protein
MKQKFTFRFQLMMYVALLFFNAIGQVWSQTTVYGFIRDQESREVLPAANIRIAGGYRGTISNDDGKFRIELQQIPDTLIISYIGYESQKIIIGANPGQELHIFLKRILLEMPPVIVIAEDPAIDIMRKVISKKKIWRDALKTYQARAYSRLVLENDSGIVSIAESISETYWDREKGLRELIKSKKQTSNLSDQENLAVASYIPNFYDDDIDEQGYKVIGPTHPDALKYYDFKLEKVRYLDDQDVFTIRVIPASKLQPTFAGTLDVQDSTFALLAVSLKPGSAILYPWPIQEWNLQYRQQFSNFGNIYWLPVDYRVEGTIRFGLTGLQFPRIHYKRITGLTDYQINIPLPDSLYQLKNFLTVDSLTLKDPSLFTERQAIIPLTQREEVAYQTLDSTMTLRKAFKPSGFLARMVEVQVQGDREDKGKNSGNFFKYFSPQVWFNRVDGLHAGLEYSLRLTDQLHSSLLAAYNTGLECGAYAAGLEYRFSSKNPVRLKVAYSSNTDTRDGDSENYSRSLASAAPLLAAADYFDYYWNKSFLVETALPGGLFNSVITVRFNSENHRSVSKQTDFNLPGSDYTQRPNPEIESGNLRSLELQIRFGDEYIPFGVVGQKRLEFNIESSSPRLFRSDYNYTRYTAAADLSLKTWLKRRLLPMSLDIHLVGGYAQGKLPVQKLYTIDGGLLGFSPFGTLRTLASRPYEGEKFAAIFMEHNFRTTLFELMGLDYLTRNGIGIIIHGAAGRTWISEERLETNGFEIRHTDRLHYEAGLSLNGLFNIFRLDLTRRLDRNDTFIGFGLSRFF